MKLFRILTVAVLAVCLLVGLPFTAQAKEEFRAVYLDAAYKINDNQIVFDFSEPIKINQKLPCIDIRMTSTSGGIIRKRDAAGNAVGYYRWTALSFEYLDGEHDKLIFTLGGLGFTDLLAGNWDGCTPAIKEKIDKGTYRFMIGIEEKYLVNENEVLRDGMIKNMVSEKDDNVYLWPLRLDAGECAYWWIDELLEKPADLTVDPAKFESMSGKGQDWDHNILKRGSTPLTPQVLTQVKNDPLVIAAMLGGAVLVVLVAALVKVAIRKGKEAQK